jgi:predicted alpha/beta superfamily hydrolase
MIKNTDLFQKYFFGSPSLQYNDFALIDSLVNMPPDKLSSIKAIYISVGEKESGTMLKGFANLRDHLQRKNIPSLNITAYIVDDEDHRSAAYIAFFKAMKYLC